MSLCQCCCVIMSQVWTRLKRTIFIFYNLFEEFPYSLRYLVCIFEAPAGERRCILLALARHAQFQGQHTRGTSCRDKLSTDDGQRYPSSVNWHVNRVLIKCGLRPSRVNRPRSIYQYSSMAPRLSGQNCYFLKFLLSFNSQKRLGNKENNTKYRNLTWKRRSHARILIYRTWSIGRSEINQGTGAS